MFSVIKNTRFDNEERNGHEQDLKQLEIKKIQEEAEKKSEDKITEITKGSQEQIKDLIFTQKKEKRIPDQNIDQLTEDISSIVEEAIIESRIVKVDVMLEYGKKTILSLLKYADNGLTFKELIEKFDEMNINVSVSTMAYEIMNFYKQGIIEYDHSSSEYPLLMTTIRLK